MHCVCGANFSWRSAVPVVPCTWFHRSEDRGWHCCPHCPPAVHAKLATAKAARAAALLPVGAVAASAAVAGVAAGAALAAAVVVIPAATCGPLALAYEPVRRARNAKLTREAALPPRTHPRLHPRTAPRRPRRKPHKNHLAVAAASGAALVGTAVLYAAFSGHESD